VQPGERFAIQGQMRSYNKIINGQNRLVLTIFCKQILKEFDEKINPNEIELEGFICKPTTYRVTPFGREITDILIAVNRAYNKSDYIPCIIWGRNARYAGMFNVGDRVKVYGRIQAREYEKVLENGEKEVRTAYEVSVSRIEKSI
jgi:retron-type reverse transcriptase